jgi:hypothetical protein
LYQPIFILNRSERGWFFITEMVADVVEPAQDAADALGIVALSFRGRAFGIGGSQSCGLAGAAVTSYSLVLKRLNTRRAADLCPCVRSSALNMYPFTPPHHTEEKLKTWLLLHSACPKRTNFFSFVSV